MHEMEGSVKSGVLKKKSSSGCLIIKKKIGDKNSEAGFGGLSSNSKEKNRARLLESGSSSSDEDELLEFMRRKVIEKRLNNGSKRHKRNGLENRECGRDNVGVEASGEKKRSRLDLFDFDEYDEFDAKKMRSESLEDRFKKIRQSASGKKLKESGVGSSNRNNFVVGKRKKVNKGLALEEDEPDVPNSSLKSKHQKTASEPIRLQGKNGVLKVMVNKKKKVDCPSQPRNGDDVKKDLSMTLKSPEKRGFFVDKEESVEKEKKDKVKGDIQTYSSKKRMKKEELRSPSPENPTPVKGKEVKESKAQRGGSTEKQKLREKIRGMLLDAGWTIDYRPRRNRDYSDAVYINTTGTAYWSITKAYDALKKQLEKDDGKTKLKICSSSFAPLSENMINKLTRQTKKKVKEEMKRRRKERSSVGESSDSDENEERLRSYMKRNSKSRKGKLSETDQDTDDDLSDDDSPNRNAGKVKAEKPSRGFNSNVVQGRTSKEIGRCTLMVRGYGKGESSDSDGHVPYSGKRTVLAWLIDSGKARLSEKVQYMNRKRTRVMLEGWITRDGIHCGCCSKILTVSKFELHAGSKLRQSFQNIYLESGLSLLQCQIDAWNSQEESLRRDFFTVDVDGDDPDDDTCGVCGDGGDLICCDSCPSTFHQTCLEIKVLPSDDWHCPNCTCKFCGYANGNAAEENNEPNRCSLCEKKYHKSCSEKATAQLMNSNGASFCGRKCQELYDHLQKILGTKHELEAGYSWSLIRQTDVSDASQRGFHQRVECNSKLAVALSVMDECFLPIIDRKSGINLIHNVVYNCGSNFNRLNFCGFYTAILERGDEMISAASIRLHGDRLAEMPFIGTREIYRRQGMCRRLLSAIETELSSLKVGQLIIPTISEHMNTWTTVFDFHKLEDAHKKEIKSMNMVVFPGTDMLQKQLVEQENSDGVKISESTNNLPQLPVLVEKFDRQASGESGPCVEPKKKDEIDAVDSDSQAPIIHPRAISESDNTTACVPVEPEIENEQKESSAGSKCKIEAPSVESIHDSSNITTNAGEVTGFESSVTLESSKFENVEVNEDRSIKAPEDSGPTKTVDNGYNESLTNSASENPTESAKDQVTCNEDPLEQLNHETKTLDPGVEGNIVACNADVSDKAQLEVKSGHDETDKPNEENETPHVVNGKLDSPISCSETSAQDTTTTENHVE